MKFGCSTKRQSKRAYCFLAKNRRYINVKVEISEDKGKVALEEIAKRAEKQQAKRRVAYKMIKKYIEEKCSFKIHIL